MKKDSEVKKNKRNLAPLFRFLVFTAIVIGALLVFSSFVFLLFVWKCCKFIQLAEVFSTVGVGMASIGFAILKFMDKKKCERK